MTKLNIKKDFPYFHGGCNRVEYVAGQVVDVDDEEMIEVAISEGWATNGEAKAVKSAPENKKAK